MIHLHWEMGTQLSKVAVFVKGLKVALRESGVRVKKKDLINFYIFINQACPWFIIDGADTSQEMEKSR